MKTVVCSFCLCASTLFATQLTVNVEFQRPCDSFKLSVCAQNEKFPPSADKGCSLWLKSSTKSGTSKFLFILPENGKYAAIGFCDENNDKVLNRSWIGRPKEPYGASNYEGGLLPPTFAGSSIFVENEGSIVLKLIYP